MILWPRAGCLRRGFKPFGSARRLFVRRVIDTVGVGDRFLRPRRGPVDTPQIDAALRGVGSTLVVHVDATDLAEVMFRRMAAPGVERQMLGSFGHLERAGERRHRRCRAAAAKGTGAACGRGEPLWQGGGQGDAAAVTGRAMGAGGHFRFTFGIRLAEVG